MKIKFKRQIAVAIFSAVLVLSAILGRSVRKRTVKTGDYGLSNPVIDSEGVTTWDCVYFGHYYQNNETVKEPIKWRVLSSDGDDAFLLADQNLDSRQYNTINDNVAWENSTLRSWLNGYAGGSNAVGVDYRDNNFLDIAFSRAEQTAIQSTKVINQDNFQNKISVKHTTYDKCYLLSIAEVSNVSYGFHSLFHKSSQTRTAVNSAHVAANPSMSSANGIDWWWLRSVGDNSGHALVVDHDGNSSYSGYDVNSVGVAVRPVLHLNLSSPTWRKAGLVNSRERNNK